MLKGYREQRYGAILARQAGHRALSGQDRRGPSYFNSAPDDIPSRPFWWHVGTWHAGWAFYYGGQALPATCFACALDYEHDSVALNPFVEAACGMKWVAAGKTGWLFCRDQAL